MVRDGVKGIRNADVVVGPVRTFRDHDVGSDPCEVGLISERNEVEHQLYLVGEGVQFANGSFGNGEGGKIGCAGFLRTPLDLTDAFEIRVENGPVTAAEVALQALCTVKDQIEEAVRMPADRGALLGRVALTE